MRRQNITITIIAINSPLVSPDDDEGAGESGAGVGD
jgi:hypothetical protein